MKKIIFIVFMITVVASQADDGKGNYAIWGVGNQSCFKYSKARSTDDEVTYKNYIMGYLTAYNALMPNTFRISGNMNIDDIFDWLDNHCELKQLDSFDFALSSYIDDNADKRLKKSPRRDSLQ